MAALSDLQVYMTDSRGVMRGKCKVCQCKGFKRNDKDNRVACAGCGHPPVKHYNQDSEKTTETSTESIEVVSMSFSPRSSSEAMDNDDDDMKCQYSRCPNIAYLDLNTGESSVYCEKHMNIVQQAPLVTAIRNTLPPQLTMEICKLPGCSNFCYVDTVSGEVFDCCCRSHGQKYLLMKQQEALKSGQPLPASSENIPAELKCTNPMCNRKKYQENGKVFDFCGQTCRNNYNTQIQQHLPGGLSKPCLLPGCKLPRSGNQDDKSLKGFCGPRHKTQAEGMALLELQPDQKKYQKIAKLFFDCWSRNKSTPPSDKDVAAVFKIFNPKQEAVFTTYAQKLSNPRAEKHYHGTSVKCDLLKSKTACANQKCGVCGISRRGFDLKYIATNIPRFTRFGKGFYLAPNSSKCHDYTQGIVDYRVMLLCKVAPGNKHTVQNDKTTLTAPPPGCDSVYGASGGSLNYPEIVLYCSEAILPIYAIVYRRDGIKQIAK